MGVRHAGLAVGVALAALIPFGVGAVVALSVASHSPLESAAKPAPLVGAVETARRSGQVNVGIKVAYTEALSPATNASGTITALSVGPGDQVTTGTRVMDVSAQAVIAYVADSPLYRDIARGLTGPDVATAQGLLTELGYPAGTADGKAGIGTEKAIKAFNLANGYGKDNTVLSLASLVWVGTSPVTVGVMSVHLGGQVGPGTALFTTTAALAAITVAEPPGMVAGGDLKLVVGGVSTPYVAGSGRVTAPEAVAAMVTTLGTATEGLGTLQLVTPTTVATVPSSAVVTDAAGRTCIFASETAAPTLVTPTGGSLGTIDLDPSLAGTPVLLNPREVRGDLTCAGS
jgi:peptidoglycan hydrolase-like protein with peptidoglycan-binding domain